MQWLNEAYAKEAELEADLTAHIALTQKQPYKKRLQQHLKETRDHKRRVASRIKQLGGTASGRALPGVPRPSARWPARRWPRSRARSAPPAPPSPPRPRRICATPRRSSARSTSRSRIYSRIETLAEEVGDRETAQLAKAIRRDEERMAKFLDAELARLVKDVVRAEIPRDERATPRRRSTSRRTTSARSRTATGVVRSGARSTSGRSTTARSTTGRSTSGRSTTRRTRATSRA